MVACSDRRPRRPKKCGAPRGVTRRGQFVLPTQGHHFEGRESVVTSSLRSLRIARLNAS